MIGTAADCLAVYGNDTALFAVVCQPVIQTLCECIWVNSFENSAKCVTTGYPIGQFEEGFQPFLSFFSEVLHIFEICSVANETAQCNDENVYQLVKNVTVAGSARIFDFLKPSCQFFQFHALILPHFI
jgi:hypothetical protein